MVRTIIIAILCISCAIRCAKSFTSPQTRSSLIIANAATNGQRHSYVSGTSTTSLPMAQISEAEAKKGIDKVVAALRRDKAAKQELGNLTKVNNILGYGSPKAGQIAVRFNASFKKGGMGLSSVPLPFGLGQSNESEGRGTMVGQVKASLDEKSGKVVECSVFRDLGYGRAFNLKV